MRRSRKAPPTFYADDVRVRLVSRINRAEGQVRGLRRMIEEGRRCPEVLQQAASVREALRGFERALLRNYLERCATNAIRAKKAGAYDEMMKVIGRYGD